LGVGTWIHGAQTATRPVESDSALIQFPAGAQSVTTHLSRGTGLFCIQATINEKHTGFFIVDTGATSSCIDKELANRLGLQTIGRSASTSQPGSPSATTFVMYERLAFSDIVLKRGVAAIFDFHTLSTFSGFQIDGLIGDDVLRECPFTLDAARRELTFYARDAFTPPAVTPHTITLRTYGRPCVTASIEGFTGWFMLDSGQLDSLALDGIFMREHWSDVKGRHAVSIPGIDLSGPSAPLHAIFGPFEAIGMRRPRLLCRCAPAANADVAGTIGMPLLAHSRLTFDFSGQKLWVEASTPARDSAALAQHEDVNSGDVAGFTPLMTAAQNGAADAALKLIQRGAKIDTHDKPGFSALFYAAAAGN
jgi:hypothetical protein